MLFPSYKSWARTLGERQSCLQQPLRIIRSELIAGFASAHYLRPHFPSSYGLSGPGSGSIMMAEDYGVDRDRYTEEVPHLFVPKVLYPTDE